MIRNVYIGIDGGMTGAVGILDPVQNPPKVVDMPTYVVIKGKKRKTHYDCTLIRQMFTSFKNMYTEGLCVFLESAQPFPKQGGVSNFTTGHSFGFMEGILVALNIPYATVHPKTWQKEFFTGKGGDSKALAYKVASALFPTLSFQAPRGRKLDGRCDAILIAEYCRRVNTNDMEMKHVRLGQPEGLRHDQPDRNIH